MRAVIEKAVAQPSTRRLPVFREHVGKSVVAALLQRLRLHRVHTPLDLDRRAQLLQIARGTPSSDRLRRKSRRMWASSSRQHRSSPGRPGCRLRATGIVEVKRLAALNNGSGRFHVQALSAHEMPPRLAQAEASFRPSYGSAAAELAAGGLGCKNLSYCRGGTAPKRRPCYLFILYYLEAP